MLGARDRPLTPCPTRTTYGRSSGYGRVNKPRYEVAAMHAPGAAEVNAAVRIIERCLGSRVLALVLRDGGGVYISYREGVGADVARLMGDVDWRAARLL